MSKFAFTCGDINGIGPEIVIKTLNKISGKPGSKFIFICPENVFESTAKIVKPKFIFEISKPSGYSDEIDKADYKSVAIIDIGKFKKNLGKPTKESGQAAFTAIKLSSQLLIDKEIDAVITAPISKTAIKMAGHNYPGHTEMYAEWSGVKNYVMMFLSRKMNAALATIHIPVGSVSEKIFLSYLKSKVEIIIKTLKEDLGIPSPKVAVLGLNPHAGEEGAIGYEEKLIINPLIKLEGFSKILSGAFSPDAFFANKLYKKYDLVFGMYHDQILIPFKLINFGAGVNYTAGLPIIRTSPDHGTAFDIAGKNAASESSMIEAFSYARKILKNRSLLNAGKKINAC